MSRPSRFSPEVRERGIRMVLERALTRNPLILVMTLSNSSARPSDIGISLASDKRMAMTIKEAANLTHQHAVEEFEAKW